MIENQLTLTRNSWTSFKLFCVYAISLNANKFITPVLVYKMKYLLKCQYWNCQFSNFIDTHGKHI